ncbi:hypothetical protein [Streptomyces sp. ST1020]|nr:hypothetical protein [Streptomyces sp. ST1020]
MTDSEWEKLGRLQAQWDKERAERLMERDVLKRSMVLWTKDSMNR